jgi:hypothetical protein
MISVASMMVSLLAGPAGLPANRDSLTAAMIDVARRKTKPPSGEVVRSTLTRARPPRPTYDEKQVLLAGETKKGLGPKKPNPLILFW